MTLNTLTAPDCLYLAVGKYVNVDRPWFTGDIIGDIEIPGVGQALAVIIIAHPCSMRGEAGSLRKKILVSVVDKYREPPEQEWSNGHYSKMPLPDLPIKGDYHVANFDQIAPISNSQFSDNKRIACLSDNGINHLQQRLINHLTRFVVPIGNLQDAFSHTYFEADLLEKWVKELTKIFENPTAKFDKWIRGGGSPSRQKRLEDEKERPCVRSEMREKIKRLKEESLN